MEDADALSRLPLALHIIEQLVDCILSSTPINSRSMTQIKEASALDLILISVMMHCQSQ